MSVKNTGKRALSVLLAASMLAGNAAASMTSAPVYGAEKSDKKDEKEKYISDVFIAYGRSEKEASDWLTGHGWEPISGNNNFNAGKNSDRNAEIAAVMGIRRTNNAKEAITDMAVMNMDGGYDFPEYEDLVNEKKEEIDEFINIFLTTIDEYRANYNGQGSELGQQRAELAFEMLNKFCDGGPSEKYMANDTGLPLGELFLEPLVQEGGGDGCGDLQQIILESTGPAVTAVETALALASDTGEDTWLDRLSYLTDKELTENIGSYIPSLDGQDVAHSAAIQYYSLNYGDCADRLADQWQSVHDNMLWYEKFIADHDLKQHDDETDEDYTDRYDSIIAEIKAQVEADPENNQGELTKYLDLSMLYPGLYTISYQGEWGDTLGDFFNPQGDASYKDLLEPFLPLAVALSEGQRNALDILTLESLIKLGFADDENFIDQLPDVTDLLDGMNEISIYAGSNRAIFRGKVALTKEAFMETVKSDDPSDLWSMSRGVNILATCALIGAVVSIVGGVYCFIRAKDYLSKAYHPKEVDFVLKHSRTVENYMKAVDDIRDIQLKDANYMAAGNDIQIKIKNYVSDIEREAANDMLTLNKNMLTDAINQVDAQNQTFRENLLDRNLLDNRTNDALVIKEKRTLGYVLIGVGIALTLTAIIAKAIDIAAYSSTREKNYQRDFTPIPTSFER